MKFTKKGFEFGLRSIVIPLIILIIIVALFSKSFFEEKKIEEETYASLTYETIPLLDEVLCNPQRWVCIPPITTTSNDVTLHHLYIQNLAEIEGDFKISLTGISTDNTKFRESSDDVSYYLDSADCGRLLIIPYDEMITMSRKEVVKVPFYLDKRNAKESCAFTSSFKLIHYEPSFQKLNTGDGHTESVTIIVAIE